MTRNLEPRVPQGVDVNRPSIARVYDYYLDGKDNFAADRALGDKLMASGLDPRRLARVNRDFLTRAVRYVASQGVGQFIDLGSGLPTSPNVHETAREFLPGARVAYVDHDPIVIAHNRAMLDTGDGVVTVQADVREPETVLASPVIRDCLDYSRPVAVVLLGILHFLSDEENPAGIIAAFRDALAPGSYLVLSTATSEGAEPALVADTTSTYRGSGAGTPFLVRSREEIQRFFDGWDLVEPGLVNMQTWRPTESTDRIPLKAASLSGVAVKP
jgi:O-methyltransferase involved in polyketide biosynthesis